MAKLAGTAGTKWQQRSAVAGAEYLSGSQNTTKDQAASAIAAKAIYQAALQESFSRDAFSKGLQKSGKQGWLAGIQQKGEANFTQGVSAPKSLQTYVTNSGAFDNARGAAASLPRGPKGSPQNLARVTAVVNALHNAKIGK